MDVFVIHRLQFIFDMTMSGFVAKNGVNPATACLVVKPHNILQQRLSLRTHHTISLLYK